MTDNRNPEAAWTYHDATKHSYTSIRTNPHFMDWSNQPLPFRIYPTLQPMRLPGELRQTGVAALSAIAESVPAHTNASPDLEAVAQLLYLSAGITRKRSYPGGEIYFRAAACTGALYEVELYLVCGDLANLEAGVYHFAAAEFGLRKLRAGDYRSVLIEATAAEPGIVNALLDVDPRREVAFSLVPLGHVSAVPQQPPTPVSPLGFETVPLSRHEIDYPLMREMHAASSLHSSAEVAAWRGGTPLIISPPPKEPVVQLQPLYDAETPRDPIEQVILRRGSSRKFARTPIALAQLSTMLDRATRGVPADFLDPVGSQLNHLYLIVHAVEGLGPGAYVFHRGRKSLECLKQGDFRSQAGYLGLQQALPADAAVDVFFLADLRPTLQRSGNRGYRAVQLEAGILGGKLYLAAYAQHLGATGLTFFDDDVTQFFSPHADGKSAIFLVALGHSAKPWP